MHVCTQQTAAVPSTCTAPMPSEPSGVGKGKVSHQTWVHTVPNHTLSNGHRLPSWHCSVLLECNLVVKVYVEVVA